MAAQVSRILSDSMWRQIGEVSRMNSVLLRRSCTLMGAALVAASAWGTSEPETTPEERGEEPLPLGELITLLNQLMVGGKIVDAYQTTVPGLVEFHLEDGDLFFATDDGRYLFTGEVYERVGKNSLVNLTETRRQERFFRLVDPNSSISFRPEGETVAVAYVFTDYTCGYCRALHKNIDNYLSRGIEIRYLAYPRSGKQSQVYQDMVSIWCADDPKDAMTEAKRGREFARAFCAHPVDVHMKLGGLMGVRGTPTIVLDNGRTFPGLVRAKRLLQEASP